MKRTFAWLALAAATALPAAAESFTYTVDPAAGTVTELSTVKVTFPEWYDVDFNSQDALTVDFNGTPIEGVETGKDGDNCIKFTLPSTMTAAGDYNFNIPAASICGFDESYSKYADLEEDIVISYKIESSKGNLDFAYTAKPAEGNVTKDLDQVRFTFPGLSDYWIKLDASKVSVTVDGVARPEESLIVLDPSITGRPTMDFTTITFSPMIESGLVVVNIESEAIAVYESNSTESTLLGTNSMPIQATFNVVKPVAYDLTLALNTPTKPNADGEISAEKQLDSFFFVADAKGLVANEDAELMNVVIRQVDGDYERKAHLSKAFGLDQNKSYFSANFMTQPSYNGEYVITIEKGAFGDETWAADNQYGHTNGEIEFRFTLVDGKSVKTLDLKPEMITPEAGSIAATDLQTVTVRFAEGVAPVKEAYATLAGINVSYLENAFFKAEADGSYTATFAAAPTELGKYQLSIESGMFGDADFLAGNGGHGNEAIEMEFEVTSLVGIDGIAADSEADNAVYTLTGIRVAEGAALPAGIYVKGGKKVIVK